MAEYVVGTKVLNDWEITRLIGQGSFGKVYEIQKNNYGVISKSALKVIHIPGSEDELKSVMYEGMDEKTATSYFRGITQEIVNEISIMISLKSHANIVSCEDYSVIEYEEAIGWDILIRMELLVPLQEYFANKVILEDEVIQLGKELCSAVSFCQKKKLVHRDIKPANIFVNEEGQFKLGDFGIARTVEKTASGLSQKGTLNYMAPEIYFGRPYGPSVDIYSIGLVLYKLMNGNRLPFLPEAPQPIRHGDYEEALKRRTSGETIPKPIFASEGFADIIVKACSCNLDERYHTADDMMKDLQSLAKNKSECVEDEDEKTFLMLRKKKEEKKEIENVDITLQNDETQARIQEKKTSSDEVLEGMESSQQQKRQIVINKKSIVKSVTAIVLIVALLGTGSYIKTNCFCDNCTKFLVGKTKKDNPENSGVLCKKCHEENWVCHQCDKELNVNIKNVAEGFIYCDDCMLGWEPGI